MDIICTNCGEPWDVYHILHDAPADFDRIGANIKNCPYCPCSNTEVRPRQTEELGRREAMEIIADMMGNDLDGAAAMWEDFELSH